MSFSLLPSRCPIATSPSIGYISIQFPSFDRRICPQPCGRPVEFMSKNFFAPSVSLLEHRSGSQKANVQYCVIENPEGMLKFMSRCSFEKSANNLNSFSFFCFCTRFCPCDANGSESDKASMMQNKNLHGFIMLKIKDSYNRLPCSLFTGKEESGKCKNG